MEWSILNNKKEYNDEIEASDNNNILNLFKAINNIYKVDKIKTLGALEGLIF